MLKFDCYIIEKFTIKKAKKSEKLYIPVNLTIFETQNVIIWIRLLVSVLLVVVAGLLL